jgi:hypothetical protein
MNGDGISEAASENQPKRRRGRPPKPLANSASPAGRYAILRTLEDGRLGDPLALGRSQAKTLRGCQDAEYAFRGANAIFNLHDEYPEVAALTGVARDSDGELHPDDNRTFKNQGVLAELGRIVEAFPDGADYAARLAVQLVAIKPRLTSKQAIRRLRRCRMRRLKGVDMEAAGNARGVCMAITKALDDYLDKNPATSPRDVQDALFYLWKCETSQDKSVDPG